MSETAKLGPIAVMGAGAVGCYYGGMLARAGHDVTLVGRAQHVEAVRRTGLRVEAKAFDASVPMRASEEARGARGAKLVLFSVKSPDTERAGAALAPHLERDAFVLSLQNGVDNAERLAATLGREVMPATVYAAVEMTGPGHVRHNGRGVYEEMGVRAEMFTRRAGHYYENWGEIYENWIAKAEDCIRRLRELDIRDLPEVEPEAVVFSHRGLTTSYDLLQTVIEEGHARGIKVHASINVFSEGHKTFHAGPAYSRQQWQSVIYEVQRTIIGSDGDRHRSPARSAPLCRRERFRQRCRARSDRSIAQ